MQERAKKEREDREKNGKTARGRETLGKKFLSPSRSPSFQKLLKRDFGELFCNVAIGAMDGVVAGVGIPE